MPLLLVLLIYNLLLPFALLVLLPVSVLKMRRRGGYGAKFWQRFGFFDKAAAAQLEAVRGRCRWMHAVSVGEVNVARKLIRELLKQAPDIPVVLSVTTSTGYAVAHDKAPAGLTGFTRALTKPEGKWPVKWPVLAPIGSEKLLLVEDWTLDVKRADPANEKLFNFTLNGSKTGADGEGRSDQKFISNSGRIVIMPEDWNAAYALALAGIKPVPESFTVKWSVVPRFVDEFISPGIKDPAIETTITLAQGLANTQHTLEIDGGAETIAALRVYRPVLAAKETK